MDSGQPIALYFSARKLPGYGESECKVYVMHNEWLEVGRTEVVMNDCNPDWTQNVILQYFFESTTDLQICIYHQSSLKLSFKTTLSELASTSVSSYQDNQIELIVRSEEARERDYIIFLELEGKNLLDKDTFSLSDPYFQISRQRHNDFVKIYQSEVIDNCLSPHWKPFKLSSQDTGDFDAPLRIQIFDKDDVGSDEFMGEVFTSVNQLQQLEFLSLKEKQKPAGFLVIKKVSVEKEFSILDYFRAGTKVNLIVGIDFTSSNCDPSDPTSLHFCSPHKGNAYEETILNVGSVLEKYDFDKKFPVFGFGAKVNNEVSHCFAMNMDEEKPFVHGFKGILDCYRNILPKIVFFGPTYFHFLLERVLSYMTHESTYYILLIITDGVIVDMTETVDLIVRASSLPLSIIIVGVGDESFEKMKELDCDDSRLVSSRGEVAKRDIVQFVKYTGQLELASEVLNEIPDQVESYLKLSPYSQVF